MDMLKKILCIMTGIPVVCIVFSDGLKQIYYSAFEGCTSLKSIDSYAFAWCEKLKVVKINSTALRMIGKAAFKEDKRLASITIKSARLKTVGKLAEKAKNGGSNILSCINNGISVKYHKDYLGIIS